MNMRADSYIEIDGQYHRGVCLDEYRDTVSVCNANVSKDGQTYTEWCFPAFDGKPKEVSLPWAVRLGDKTNAIRILKELVLYLESEPEPEPEPEQEPEKEPERDTKTDTERQADIPF